MNRTSFSTLSIFAALLFGCTSEKKAPVQEKKPAPVAETKADPAPQPASTDTTAGNPGCFGDPKGGDPREVEVRQGVQKNYVTKKRPNRSELYR